MKAKKFLAFILLILVPILTLPNSTLAQANSLCVSNWPNNIWEESVPEEAIFSLTRSVASGNERVEVTSNQKVWAITVPKLLPLVQSEITNLKGSISIKQELLTITPDWKIGTHTYGQAYLYVKSGGGLLSRANMPPFEHLIVNVRPSTFVPSAILRVKNTVSTPGCTPRVFISPGWQNKNYQLPMLDSPEVASWESNFDFQKVNQDKTWLNDELKVTQLNYDSRWVQFPTWIRAGDFTQCGGVFPDSDLPRTPNCQVNFYANHQGMFISLGRKTVNMSPKQSAPAIPSESSTNKKTTITCIKGKLIKKVTAVKPKCPNGYKVKK
jgi:hypothetical protein